MSSSSLSNAPSISKTDTCTIHLILSIIVPTHMAKKSALLTMILDVVCLSANERPYQSIHNLKDIARFCCCIISTGVSTRWLSQWQLWSVNFSWFIQSWFYNRSILQHNCRVMYLCLTWLRFEGCTQVSDSGQSTHRCTHAALLSKVVISLPQKTKNKSTRKKVIRER